MTITKEDKQAALVHLAEWFPQTFVLEKYLPHRPLSAEQHPLHLRPERSGCAR